MWFKHAPKQTSVTIDVTNFPIKNKTMSLLGSHFCYEVDQSPFKDLPWTLETEDLPMRIPSERSILLDFDVSLELLEKKQLLSFWKLRVQYIVSDGRPPLFDKSCFIVMNAVKYRACEKNAALFLDGDKDLDVYIDGGYRGSLSLGHIISVLLLGDDGEATENKIIRSNN